MSIKQIFADNNLQIQQGTSNCGPVTLLNVLRLKGDMSHTEDELAGLCKTVLGVGTQIEDMVRVAKQIGLEVVEEKKDATIADIERRLDSGAYVIVNYIHAFCGQGHYTVATEYDDRAFYFADSSLGFLRIWKKDFDHWWYNEEKTAYRWFMAVK